MDRFKIHKTIGDGAYGIVYKATIIKTGEIVAIKKMKKKFYSWDECMALRELKSLRKLSHQNIIKLKEVVKVGDELHFVFEFLDQNILQLYTEIRDKGKSLTENEIRSIIYQTASGLAYMHKHGFFHRDLKPENLLIQKEVLKVADFGLAREIRSRPPYTDYIATRWYRAPELLLKSTNYNSPVDIFALGCIMAELYLLAPLFNGNSEMDQIYKICSILGTPSQKAWSEGYQLATKMGFTFPQFEPVPLSKVIPNASSEALQLIAEMLRYDPHKRITAAQILQHPFFAGFVPIDRGLSDDINTRTGQPISREFPNSNGKGIPSLDKQTEDNDIGNFESKTNLSPFEHFDASFGSNSRERNRDLNFASNKGDKDSKDILGYGPTTRKAESQNQSKHTLIQNSRGSIPNLPPAGNQMGLYGSNNQLEGRFSNSAKLTNLNPLVLPHKFQIGQQPGHLNVNLSGKYLNQGGIDSLDFLTKNDYTGNLSHKPTPSNIATLKNDKNLYDFSNAKPTLPGISTNSIGLSRNGLSDYPFNNHSVKNNLDKIGMINPGLGERQPNFPPTIVGGFDYVGRHKF